MPAAADLGATVAANVSDVFAHCNTVILMLLDGAAIDPSSSARLRIMRHWLIAAAEAHG
jgi:3-hydroxyisobutyrate dehydrogenase-like beta-hydroxyacid dehydrogenase